MRQSAFIANAVQVVLTGMLWMLSAQAFGQSPSDAPLPLSQLQIHDEFLQPYFPDGLFIAFNPTLATVLQHPIEDASFREPGDPLTTRLLETRLTPHDDDRYVIDFSPGGSLDPTFLISRDDGHALQEIGQVFGVYVHLRDFTKVAEKLFDIRPREAVVPDDVFFGNPQHSEQYRCQDAGPVLADGAVEDEGMVCRRGDDLQRCQDFPAEFLAPH